jgi:hypothetical protein
MDNFTYLYILSFLCGLFELRRDKVIVFLFVKLGLTRINSNAVLCMLYTKH